MASRTLFCWLLLVLRLVGVLELVDTFKLQLGLRFRHKTAWQSLNGLEVLIFLSWIINVRLIYLIRAWPLTAVEFERVVFQARQFRAYELNGLIFKGTARSVVCDPFFKLLVVLLLDLFLTKFSPHSIKKFVEALLTPLPEPVRAWLCYLDRAGVVRLRFPNSRRTSHATWWK